MAMQSDPAIEKSLARFTAFGSVLSAGFGLLVLAGWTFQVATLKSIPSGQPEVRGNAAICLILLGLALWWQRNEKQAPATVLRLGAKTSGTIAGTVGLLSALEYLFGWDLGIDQLLFTAGAAGVPGTIRPGLMPPLVGVSFFLLGNALVLLDARDLKLRWLLQSLPISVMITGMFGVLDFVLDQHTTHTQIAPMTALVLMLYSAALVCARTQAGLGALLVSRGAAGMLARRVLPASVLTPMLVAWLRRMGAESHLYSTWTGVAIMTVSAAALLGALTVWTGFVIDRADTERSRVEEALRESERRYRVLFSEMAVRFVLFEVIYDEDGKPYDFRYLAVNSAHETESGLSQDEVLGKTVRQVLPNIDPFWMETYGKVAASGESIHTERYEEALDRWLDVTAFRVCEGQVGVTFADVSARKRLEESRERLACIVDSSDDAIFSKTLDGVITTWNKGAERLYGYAAAEAIGRPLTLVAPPELHSELDSLLKSVGRGECVDHYDTVRLRKDGTRIDVSVTLSPLRDETGKIVGVSTVVRDVTERKRAEETLREREERIRALLDSTAEAIFGDDLNGRCSFCNSATAELLGYGTPAEILGKDVHALIHHKRPDGTRLSTEDCPIAQAVRAGRNYHAEDVVFWRKDGTCFPAECWSHPLFEAGKLAGSVVTFLDITERKQAEEEIRQLNRELEDRVEERTLQLRESEQSVRRKLDNILSPEGDLGNLELADILDIPAVQELLNDFYPVVRVVTAVLDLHGKVLTAVGWQDICVKFHRAHPESCKNCVESDLHLSAGVPAGEFKLYKCKNNMWDAATPIVVGGHHLGNLYCGQFFFSDEQVDRELFRAQARKYGFNEEDYLSAVDAVTRLSRSEVNASMSFLTRLAKVISQLSYSRIQLARSATQLSRSNEELANSVKELEAFTYSVSHDLRAPLRHISGFSKILTEEFGPALPEEAQRHVQRIEDGTRRMGLLVDDLLNLARVGRRDINLRVAGLSSLVDEVLADLKPELEGRKIEWKVGALPSVKCDPGLIRLVFQNVISNAVKFTRPRPQAVIEIGQREESGAPVVYIRDNGVGFSMKYADKLFGVFQRLHRAEDFEGTGVGLATVQRIIQKHGGRIWVDAELDKGATFYFTVGHSRNTEHNAKAMEVGEKA